MDILAIEIASSMVAEQGGMQVGASEKASRDGRSFAESFDQRIGFDANSVGKMSTHQVVEEFPKASLQISKDAVAVPFASGKHVVAGQATTFVRSKGDAHSQADSQGVVANVADETQAAALFRSTTGEPGDTTEADGKQAVALPQAFFQGLKDRVNAADANEIREVVARATEESAMGGVNVQEGPSQTIAGTSADRRPVLHADESGVNLKRIDVAKQEPVSFSKKASKEVPGEEKHSIALKNACAVNSVAIASGTLAGTMGIQPSVVFPSASIPAPAAAPVASTPGKKRPSGKELQEGAITAVNADRKSTVTSASNKGGAGGATGKASAGGVESTKLAAGDAPSSTKSGSAIEKVVGPNASAVAGSAQKIHGTGAAAVLQNANSEITGHLAGAISTHMASPVISSRHQSGNVNDPLIAEHSAAGEQDGSGTEVLSASNGGHRTLTATPTALEIGISSGTEGWLKIRAEMAAGGGVNASLSAAIPAGQEMLHRELPSLTAFLQQERVAVNTVVVHASSTVGTDPRAFGGAVGGDGGGQAQHRNNQGGTGREVNVMPSYTDKTVNDGLNAIDADGLVSPLRYAGGSWLSVRA